MVTMKKWIEKECKKEVAWIIRIGWYHGYEEYTVDFVDGSTIDFFIGPNGYTIK